MTLSPHARPLFLLAALFAPIGVIAPKALVILMLVIALWLLARRWQNGELLRPLQISHLKIFALISIWAFLSTFWALDFIAALLTLGKLVGVLFATLIILDGIKDLNTNDNRIIRHAILVATALAILFLGLESLSEATFHQWWYNWRGKSADFEQTVLNRAETILLLAIWPGALVLIQKGNLIWAFTLVLIGSCIILSGVSNSNQLALMLALFGSFVAWWTGPWMQRFLAGFIMLGVLITPLLPSNFLEPRTLEHYFGEKNYSGLHRLHIWFFSGERILEAPIIGWGLDASRRIPGGNTKLTGGGNVMSVHPHNASLQIWLELGLVGAILWAVLLAYMWTQIGNLRSCQLRAIATGMLLAGLTVAHLSYGIWQTWWLAALAQSGILYMLTFYVAPEKQNDN